MALSKTQHTIFWQEGTVLNGSTSYGYNTGVSQLFGGTAQQEPPGPDDELEFRVNLDPGDYNMTTTAIHADSSGIHELYFDNVLVATIDHYSPTFDFNIINVIPVTVVNPVSFLRSRVIGKDAASLNFYIAMTRVYFEKI